MLKGLFVRKSNVASIDPKDSAVQDEIRDLMKIASAPFPQARIPEGLIEPHKQRSYDEVAKQLGFAPAELVRAQLLEFFEAEGIKLYDYNQMSTWLTEKKKQANVTNWCWRALREKDVIKDYQWGFQGWNGGKDVWDDGFYVSGQLGCRPYDRLVPLHALEKVVKIEAKFGDRVKFFVSDYASPKADPFIMVRPEAMHASGTSVEYRLVFDAWDEPGFGL